MLCHLSQSLVMRMSSVRIICYTPKGTCALSEGAPNASQFSLVFLEKNALFRRRSFMTHLAPFRQSRILVSPATVMLDTPLQIRLVSFPLLHPITVRMGMHDELGGSWRAHATFLTDQH